MNFEMKRALVCLFISITSKYLSRFSVVLFACCGTPLLEIISLCGHSSHCV